MELAAKFIEKESPPNTLVTVTNCDISKKFDYATILITVLPDEKETEIIKYFEKKIGTFRKYISENLKKFSEIKIFEIYKNSQIEIDMFNHYKISGEMVNFFITGDGDSLSKKELKTLLKVCTAVISEGNKTIKNFSSSDWVEKIINLRYLWLKPHKDILGKDWKPPRNIFNLTKKINEAKKAGEQFEKNIIPLVSGLSPNEVVDKIAQLFVNKIF